MTAGTGLDRNKAVVRALVEAINAQDWDRLDDVVTPDFVRHSFAGGAPAVRSLDDFKRFLRGELETFPDAHETLEDVVAEGDRVAARHRFRGTQLGAMGPHPPLGRMLTADYVAIYRLVDEVIVEAWAEWDNLTGLRQLGHLEPPGASPAGG